jgi:sec-independent protein translocase protein TatB
MGLENIGGWELIVIVLVGLFIFGPDKLPKAISDGLRMLRTVREMARNATTDLSRELGTTVELEDLNPKTFLRKHLLSEEDEQALRKPLQDIVGDVRGVADSVKVEADRASASIRSSTAESSTPKAIAERSYDDVT